jgi:hypothetical protein
MRTVTSKDGTRLAFDQSGQGSALILVAAAFATRTDQASVAAARAGTRLPMLSSARSKTSTPSLTKLVARRSSSDIPPALCWPLTPPSRSRPRS